MYEINDYTCWGENKAIPCILSFTSDVMKATRIVVAVFKSRVGVEYSITIVHTSTNVKSLEIQFIKIDRRNL
jgi:hypothetical protein